MAYVWGGSDILNSLSASSTSPSREMTHIAKRITSSGHGSLPTSLRNAISNPPDPTCPVELHILFNYSAASGLDGASSQELGDNGRRRGSILGLVIRGGATATAREGTKACSGKERVRMSFFSHTFGVPSFRDERRGREENVTL